MDETINRRLFIINKSPSLLKLIQSIEVNDFDPLSSFVGFIIGSFVKNNYLNEQEYIQSYPSLITVFKHNDCLKRIKQNYMINNHKESVVKKYQIEMKKIFSLIDAKTKQDIIFLFLSIIMKNGKISIRDRKYLDSLQ